MAPGKRTGGRVKGVLSKKTRVRMDLINVMLRDGSRKPLDVVAHAMNVEVEAAERKAAFELAEAVAEAEAAGDERAKQRAESTIYPDYSKAVMNASALMAYLHPKLANVTVNADEKSPEEIEASFKAIVSKLDAIAAKKAVTFIPPGNDKVIDLTRRRVEDETK